MTGESGVTGNIIDELHSWDIQEDQMLGESGVTRSITDELHSPDIQGDQIECESGVTLSIIDGLLLSYPTRSKGRRTWCHSKEHSRTSFLGYPTRSNGR